VSVPKLGLRENLGQFTLLVGLNAFVGAMDHHDLPHIQSTPCHVGAQPGRSLDKCDARIPKSIQAESNEFGDHVATGSATASGTSVHRLQQIWVKPGGYGNRHGASPVSFVHIVHKIWLSVNVSRSSKEVLHVSFALNTTKEGL